MSRQRISLVFLCIAVIACFGLAACQYKTLAYAQIVIKDTDNKLSIESVSEQIEAVIFEKGLKKLGPDGYSAITGIPGSIDYSSDQFIVSIVNEDGQTVVRVYEKNSDFSELGNVFISQLIDTLTAWLPDASIQYQKITPSGSDANRNKEAQN